MATNVTSSTFATTYRDDFKDSDNYHRILFNSGRALQARELTQMQTIIQKEIERFGRYLFKEGSLINTTSGGVITNQDARTFLKLDETTNPLSTTPAAYEGTIIQNQDASPVKARVIKALPAAGADPATLIIEYVDTGGDSTVLFQPGQILSTDLGNLNIRLTTSIADPAIGKTSMISVPEGQFFTAGHFVYTPAQEIIVEKYNASPNAVIGYEVSEQIFTTSDSIALYDNTGTNPNLTSPGADRYRISLNLIKESDVGSGKTFFPLVELIDGTASSIQTGDNILSKLGDQIASRTFDESGNYIVNNKQRFNLNVQDDPDNNFLIYNVQPGVGYVKGRRVEQTVPTGNTYRIEKPRNLTNDTREVSGENVLVSYENYFLADTLKGLIGEMVSIKNNVKSAGNTISLFSAINRGGTNLGNVKIKNIDKVGSKFRVHIFDTNMDSSGGTPYDIKDVRSIGYDVDNYANVQVDGTNGGPIGTANNTLIFPLPIGRPADLTTISATVQEVFTDTTGAHGAGDEGKMTFTTSSASDEFADEDQWIVSIDSSGEIFTNLNISSGGAGTTSVTIDDLPSGPSGSAATALAYVNITFNPKTKTLTTGFSETVSVTGGKFTLSKHDIYKFNSIIDTVTNTDVKYKFVTDNGQRDNYYDYGSGTIRAGNSAPAQVTVNYDYFARSGSGHGYTVKSYQNIEYENIPTYRIKTTGDYVSLTDVIDLRFDIGAGDSFAGTNGNIFRIPRNRDLINIGTAKYYESRKDVIYLDQSGINVAEGVSSSDPQAPKIPSEALKLHEITLAPYTINSNDLSVSTSNNRGYKMKDIHSLSARIANLEEITTLTLSEIATNEITVTDENGVDRTKIGLTADRFVDRTFTAIPDDMTQVKTSKLHMEQALGPRILKNNILLAYDSDESSARNINLNKAGVKRVGTTLWPEYEEVVYINQNKASGPQRLNVYSLQRFEGSLTLNPDGDVWTVRKTLDRDGTTEVVIEGELSEFDIYADYGEGEE